MLVEPAEGDRIDELAACWRGRMEAKVERQGMWWKGVGSLQSRSRSRNGNIGGSRIRRVYLVLINPKK